MAGNKSDTAEYFVYLRDTIKNEDIFQENVNAVFYGRTQKHNSFPFNKNAVLHKSLKSVKNYSFDLYNYPISCFSSRNIVLQDGKYKGK